MKIHTEKIDVNVPTWLLLCAAIIADNMYANHCRKKTIKKMLEVDPKSVEKL